MVVGLYDFLEGLILARYARQKLAQLEPLNGNLHILRYQTRLLLDFNNQTLILWRHSGRKIADTLVQSGDTVIQNLDTVVQAIAQSEK